MIIAWWHKYTPANKRLLSQIKEMERIQAACADDQSPYHFDAIVPQLTSHLMTVYGPYTRPQQPCCQSHFPAHRLPSMLSAAEFQPPGILFLELSLTFIHSELLYLDWKRFCFSKHWLAVTGSTVWPTADASEVTTMWCYRYVTLLIYYYYVYVYYVVEEEMNKNCAITYLRYLRHLGNISWHNYGKVGKFCLWNSVETMWWTLVPVANLGFTSAVTLESLVASRMSLATPVIMLSRKSCL